MGSKFQVCGAATKYRQFVYNVGTAVNLPGYGVSSLAHISTYNLTKENFWTYQFKKSEFSRTKSVIPEQDTGSG